MFLLKGEYYPESSIIKITVDNKEKVITYFFAGNKTVKEVVADTDFNNVINELETSFVNINGIFYDAEKIQSFTKKDNVIKYVFVGNIIINETFDTEDDTDEKIANNFTDTHINVNDVYYNAKVLQIVETNEVALKIVYLFAGKEKITATYANQTAFDNAIEAIENSNNGGGEDSHATEKPVFSVTPGYVVGGTKVGISSATQGATIYYTNDGTTPTLESTEYENELTVGEDGLTLKAIAVKLGLSTSKVSTGVYMVDTSKGTYYKGWLLGDDATISSLDADDILGLAGLETGIVTSANSPNPNVYTAPEGITPDGGRIVWAYPAMFGKLDKFIDSLGEHAIENSYSNLQVTVNGIELEVYFLTTPITPDVGEEYAEVFVADTDSE